MNQHEEKRSYFTPIKVYKESATSTSDFIALSYQIRIEW